MESNIIYETADTYAFKVGNAYEVRINNPSGTHSTTIHKVPITPPNANKAAEASAMTLCDHYQKAIDLGFYCPAKCSYKTRPNHEP